MKPTVHRVLERAAAWTVPLLAAFGALQVFLAYRTYGSEDAYITYRYAQNLAAGQGFVFNVGERVLGTSTPLYTMVLGLAGALGLEIANAAAALYAASLGAAAILGGAILRRFAHPALAVLYAALVVWGAGDLFFFFGMETPFYLMLLLAAFRAAQARREVATGMLLGFAFLTRYDAAVFAVSLLPLWWWSERRFPWRLALASAAVVLPWLAFAAFYFGSLFPNTLTAKAGEVGALAYLRETGPWQMWSFHSPLFYFVPRERVPVEVVVVSTLLLVAPILAAGRALLRRDPLLAQLLVFPVGLWLGYSLIGASPVFAWHLTPAVYFLALLGLLSWGQVLGGGRLGAARSAAGAAFALGLVLASVAYMPGKLRDHARWLTETSFYRGRNGVYLTLARWIKDRGLQDVSVLMGEPGYFGYHSGSPMIDRAGLITKGVYFTGPRERVTPDQEIVANYEPGLIVAPQLPWPTLPFPEYLPLYHPALVGALYVRRSVFVERFEALAARWLARDGYHPDRPDLLRHPLAWDFEPDVDSGWITGGELPGVTVAPAPPLEGRPGSEERSLSTAGGRGQWGTVSTPPFLIDFDELTFQFAGSHPLYTRARLLVDGQEVLRETGRGEPLELGEVHWPVWSWAGKVGVLQFQDADTEGGYLAADHVRSIRHQRRRVLDDFEAESYGAFWESGMGDAPATLDELAVERGLAMLVGRRAASSRGSGESAQLVSRPFVLDRDRLSFLVFDFGRAATRVELVVGGEVRRRFAGTGSQSLRGVIWPAGRLRGSQAVLRVVDGVPGDHQWIGIDDIAVFDELREGGRRRGDAPRKAGAATGRRRSKPRQDGAAPPPLEEPE